MKTSLPTLIVLLPLAGFLLNGMLGNRLGKRFVSVVGCGLPIAAFGVQPFSVVFLNEYWLHFELVSVLLVAAVVAALAVLDVGRRSRRG